MVLAGVAWGQTPAASAAQRARQEQQDAQELQNEAVEAASLPGELGAAAFARKRAQQLLAEANAILGANQAPPAPSSRVTPSVAPSPGPATVPKPAPTPELNWSGWDPITSCGGVDVHLAVAPTSDGSTQARIQLLNHNSTAATVSFRTVYLGRSGQREPSAGNASVNLAPNSELTVMGERIPFVVDQYGLANVTVTSGGMSLPCPGRIKKVAQ